eukprot:2093222-Ditylum_brightwellii.AAC.1
MRLQTYFAGADKQDYNPKLYVLGTFTPKDFMIPNKSLHHIDTFQHAIKLLFKKRQGHNNLLPHQKIALYSLQKSPDFVICQCDKNLGPAILEKSIYIECALKDHLNDENI